MNNSSALRLARAWPSSWQLRAKAEIERRKRTGAIAVPDFAPWLHEVNPDWHWDWPHLVYVRSLLDQVTKGNIKRLMLFLHPRSGKSEMTTIRYPAWRLEKNPKLKVIIGAADQSLASKFSRKMRRIVRDRIGLNEERTAVTEWETTVSGGCRAVGVGVRIAGEGGDLIMIDDPVKSREEANSPAYRERVWNWFKDDIYTRLEPNGVIVLIQTRWHEDDLAGRILASEQAGDWGVVRIPALAETQEERDEYAKRIGLPTGQPDRLGRKPGAAMCPQRFPVPVLEKIRVALGNSFYALYQQRPTAAEGEMFKREWFEIVEASPAEAHRVRYWDKAGTAGGGKFTCGTLMARHGSLFYVEEVIRGRWAAAERERVIKQVAQADSMRFGNVDIWVEQEPGSGGKESAEATIARLAGFAVYADRVTGDKVTRAEPLAAQAMARNVKLVSGAWNAAYLDELTAFPSGTYTDQVDASSGAFNKLTAGGEIEIGMVELPW